MSVSTTTASVRVSASQLQAFEPQRLGSLSPEYRRILQEICEKPQSVILSVLEREARALGEEHPDVETHALAVALLVLRDYVVVGHYPLVRDGRCYLANVSGSDTLSQDQQRTMLRHRYQVTRERALRDRGQLGWLQALSERLAGLENMAHQVVAAIAAAPPQVEVVNTRSDDSAGALSPRDLWRAVRATWSMGPEASAPGRENAFVIVDRRWTQCPLAILQFRNVVPEINARDLWLGISAGSPSLGPRRGGFLGRISENPKLAAERCHQTLAVLEGLLQHVRRDGIHFAFVEDNIESLGVMARRERGMFDDSRKLLPVGEPLQNRHLQSVKRAQTAAALLRGIRVLRELSNNPRRIDSLSDLDMKDLDAGLGKIWHYHMGFVAMEMSICGAAPPFGPLRLGKLAAALAGSAEVLDAWGTDRPLGAIARQVYHEEVRSVVPNPGPLVVFTSGLFPGHSAQYNRVTSGQTAWVKIGDTAGFGSFHISPGTADAMRSLNEFVDGYERITRTFGEGSGARFRSVGQALALVGLPDLRKHETKRPLYALPLVANPQAVLLGWEPATSTPRPPLQELADVWWHRWVEGPSEKLSATAMLQADLTSAMYGLTAVVKGLG